MEFLVAFIGIDDVTDLCLELVRALSYMCLYRTKYYF